MSFIMDLEVESFIELIAKAHEKDLEDRLWEKWLVELPNMDQKSFVSFERYKEKHFKNDTQTHKTDEEILKDAENILKSMSKPK